jgi:hypothetical protein
MYIDSYVNHDVLLSLCYWRITNIGGDILFVKINGFNTDLAAISRFKFHVLKVILSLSYISIQKGQAG